MNPSEPSTSTAKPWIAVEATVTSCRFQFARMNTFTLGIQNGENFRITFDYYAHGRVYSDEFQSPIPIPQHESIRIAYNPLHPEQNSRTCRSSSCRARNPLLGIGIAGSIVLSILWMTILRGCS